MDVAAIETRQLTRRFGARTACDAISLSVPQGGVFGLLGANGAGKSTFVKMLVGLVRPTSGEARLFGRPPTSPAVRRRIGFLPENFRYQDWATGREVLAYHAALAGIDPARRRGRIASALARVGLTDDGRRPVRAYSKGMQQRLGLACALLADPPLIFLDEPTSALDPLGRRHVRELLRELRAEGRTVFLNSHLLSEVEAVCDRVAVVRSGRLLASGRLSDLLGPALEVEVRIERGDGAARRALAAFGPVLAEEPAEGGQARLRVAVSGRDQVPALAAAVVGCGGRLHGLQVRARSLEDVFVDLVSDGRAADAGAADTAAADTAAMDTAAGDAAVGDTAAADTAAADTAAADGTAAHAAAADTGAADGAAAHAAAADAGAADAAAGDGGEPAR